MEFGRAQLHLILHLLVPAAVAYGFGKPRKVRALWLMLITMVVDIDHLFATPIYEPNRCSLGFHPLHQYLIQPLYLLLALHPKTRWIGIGLLIHMGLDGIDCLLM